MPKITGVDVSNISKRNGVASLSKVSSVSLSLGAGGGSGATVINTVSLISRWDASDTASYSGSGFNVLDLAGTNNLTLSNGAAFSSSGGIKRFVLDGVNDDIGVASIPTNLRLQPSNDFSIGIWIKPHFNNSSGFQAFVGSPTVGGSFQGVSLVNGAPGSRLSPRLWVRVNSSHYSFQIMNGSLTQNAWQYLVATWDGINYQGSFSLSDVKFYLNGSLITGNTGTQTGFADLIGYNSGTEFQIGSRDSTNAFLDGEVGEAHYYGRILSAANVTSNYNATKANYGL